jgi:hypothetical protein
MGHTGSLRAWILDLGEVEELALGLDSSSICSAFCLVIDW